MVWRAKQGGPMCTVSNPSIIATTEPVGETNPPALSRREFIAAAGAFGSAALAGCATETARTPPPAGEAAQRILIADGVVLTMDPNLGDFERADVLIEGSRIAAVGPNLQAPGATRIDAAGMIVMPGFIDSHRHIWQGPLRNILPDASLAQYFKSIGTTARAAYRAE